MDAGEEDGDLYDRAVAIVLRDKKCSTSYIQRRLSVGYNKAASLVERMEKEGIVGAANPPGSARSCWPTRTPVTTRTTTPDRQGGPIFSAAAAYKFQACLRKATQLA